MSEKVNAATQAAMLKELAEQNAWLQQRGIGNAARAGAAEARVQELQAELEAARQHAGALAAELAQMKARVVPDPPAGEDGAAGGKVVSLRE